MSSLSPRTMFLLDEACAPIAKALDTPYLVGTAFTAREYRDVDVRVMLEDDVYDRLASVGEHVPTFLGLAIGEYLAARTGLPIDFQIQRHTEANALHHGPRNPLGLRGLSSYKGDGTGKPQCTCELHETSSMLGDISFVRGDSAGCTVHESVEQRDKRIFDQIARSKAMQAARMQP